MTITVTITIIGVCIGKLGFGWWSFKQRLQRSNKSLFRSARSSMVIARMLTVRRRAAVTVIVAATVARLR